GREGSDPLMRPPSKVEPPPGRHPEPSALLGSLPPPRRPLQPSLPPPRARKRRGLQDAFGEPSVPAVPTMTRHGPPPSTRLCRTCQDSLGRASWPWWTPVSPLRTLVGLKALACWKSGSRAGQRQGGSGVGRTTCPPVYHGPCHSPPAVPGCP